MQKRRHVKFVNNDGLLVICLSWLIRGVQTNWNVLIVFIPWVRSIPRRAFQLDIGIESVRMIGN